MSTDPTTMSAALNHNPPLGFTENNSLTYLATGNPCLDFFFHVVPDTPSDQFHDALQKAWDFNPSMTLKLIFNLRGIRGTGKSNKDGFFICALWLHEHHPNTLALNVDQVPGFGCFKDLVEILFRLLEGVDVRQKRKNAHKMRKMEDRRIRRSRRRNDYDDDDDDDVDDDGVVDDDDDDDEYDYEDYYNRYGHSEEVDEEEDEERMMITEEKKKKKKNEWIKERKEEMKKWKEDWKEQEKRRRIKREEEKKIKEERTRVAREERSKASREDRVRENLEFMKEQTQKAREEKKHRMTEKAKKARERYNQDLKYKFLYDKISELFASYLKSDLEYLQCGELRNITLASKWCPSIDSAYDRATLICESIAKWVFPREEYSEYDGIDDIKYMYKVRDRLRKEVLVPLHWIIEMPEIYIGANQWGILPYNRVPSIAMKRYKNLFVNHDNERFSCYLEDVKQGKAKIAAGALLPHEIIASLEEGVPDVAELQWKRMVEDLKIEGKLRDSVSVCDVSGSMSGTPMEVCVTLGLLISELNDERWKGKVITFSENPEFHNIKGDDLKSKTEFIRRMEWGNSTAFQKVFDQILKVAVDGKLGPDKMVNRVFVFSDMEFNQAAGIYDYGDDDENDDNDDEEDENDDDEDDVNGDDDGDDVSQVTDNYRSRGWETDYEMIVHKFKEKGFEQVPEIVFWNLRSSMATPVTANQRGVAMLSGFSKNLMKLFFDKDGSFTPLEAMELTIAPDEYQKLVVYD